MSYDLADLKLVTAIADSGSLSAAALRVSLATSSASARLAHLEAALQVSLFTRHARGLTPTMAGDTVVRHARQVLARLGQLEVDLAQYAGGAAGRVSILANSSALNSFLPGDLAGFRRIRPEAQLGIEERPSREIVRAIEVGEAEVGIAALTTVPAGIDAQRYRAERLVLIVPPGHRSGGETRSFAQRVTDEAFVCLSTGSSFHTFMMNVATACGVRLDVRFQGRSHGAVCNMVAAGMGVGVVPLTVAQREMADGKAPFKVVPLVEAWAERSLYLCTRRGRAMAEPTAAAVDYLRNRSG
ncbi:MAG: LysR family transcriptional regulator [Dechloromonas sp.]|nr:LysR family transcriptional regulator [Dechloromonas sp.]